MTVEPDRPEPEIAEPAPNARARALARGGEIRRRLESWSWLLPALGAVLLASPIVRAFAVDSRVFGTPTIMMYIFGVWALLIIAAARLARIDRASEAGRAPSLDEPAP